MFFYLTVFAFLLDLVILYTQWDLVLPANPLLLSMAICILSSFALPSSTLSVGSLILGNFSIFSLQVSYKLANSRSRHVPSDEVIICQRPITHVIHIHKWLISYKSVSWLSTWNMLEYLYPEITILNLNVEQIQLCMYLLITKPKNN